MFFQQAKNNHTWKIQPDPSCRLHYRAGRFLIRPFHKQRKNSQNSASIYTFWLFENKSFLTNCKEIFSAKMKIQMALLQSLQIGKNCSKFAKKKSDYYYNSLWFLMRSNMKQRILNLRILICFDCELVYLVYIIQCKLVVI